MKFAIVSDSHNNEPNILKSIDYIKKLKLKTIIHCGDVDSPESLEIFCKNFSGEIHLAFGNSDFERDKYKKLETKYKNLHIAEEILSLSLNSTKIAVNHYPWQAESLAESGKYDIVFYGHDHTPFEKIINKTKVLNPGNLDGSRHKATFAIYDTKTNKAELILLEKL